MLSRTYSCYATVYAVSVGDKKRVYLRGRAKSVSEAERPALGPIASLVILMVLEWLKGATGVFSPAGDR